MLLVLCFGFVIWWGGHFIGWGKPLRSALVLVLFSAVLAIQFTLPDESALRQTTGGTPKAWLLFGGVVLLALGYGRIIAFLKARAQSEEPDMPKHAGTFSDTELNRYARHIVLRELGGPGQKKLKNAQVLVIGAGGLGAPALQYLAAAGVGTIGVIDDDIVENTNLQRQVIHREEDIGTPKVFSAQRAMEALNPFITVRPYHRRLEEKIAEDLFADYDIILDGTDNFDTRYLANRTAVKLGKPLISGALSQWEGQLSVFDTREGGPCYQCIFPEAPAPGLAPNCSEAGVIGPLPGVVGAMMAVEAVKVITGAGSPLNDAMLIYDALYGETRRIRLSAREDCPICQKG